MAEDFGTFAPNAKLTRLIEKAREWSFKKGYKYPSSYCRRRALKIIGDNPVDYEFRGGRARFFPKRNTAEKRALLNPARFDPFEMDFIEAQLPIGGTFLDIGANVGLFSLVAARAAGANGRIIAFEPNPPVYRRLQANVAFNEAEGTAEIRPLRIAVTDKFGPVDFLDPDGNLGEGRIVDDEGSIQEGTIISVEGKPLTALLLEQEVSRVDMIKIDVEGHELTALKPFFEQAEASSWPAHIIVERGDEDHWEPLKALFDECGYEIVRSTRMNEILSRI